MDSFIVTGLAGKPTLSGTVRISGAKNAALPIMAAALLMEGETTLTNVPDIVDVHSMMQLIEGLGGFTSFTSGSAEVRAREVEGVVIDPTLAKSLRASIVLIGPILARLGSVTFPHPGGDVIGERPIDVFISGFEKLGAKFSETASTYTLAAPQGLAGGEFFFRVVSVTGTETLMMAATLAHGPVTLTNCAMEPEVVAVAEFLKACGARISGAGTPTIVIHPSALTPPPAPFAIMPDRIEAGSFLVLGALAGKELTLTGAEPTHLDAVVNALMSMGVPISVSGDSLTVSAPENLSPIGVRTHEYPGFPTDAQAPITVLLTQAEGESIVIESIFDGRLNYTSELVRMGADITPVSPHRIKVRGKTPLMAAKVESPDIRAGLAFVLAAAIANGESTIGSAHLIDRGYEKIEEKLKGIGLSIRRIQA